MEPNPDYAVHCSRVLGLDVHAQKYWERDYAPGSFDIVRIHHLLVHTPDPVAQLRKVRQWLREDGLLYVEVPNIEAEAAVKPRGEIFDLGHVVNFNPTTLRVALAQAGFEEVEDTRERHRDTTAGFFRKASPDPVARTDIGNAQRVSDAITQHYARSRPHTSLGQFVEGMAHRAAERRELKAVSGHRHAAESAVRRVKAALGL